MCLKNNCEITCGDDFFVDMENKPEMNLLNLHETSTQQ